MVVVFPFVPVTPTSGNRSEGRPKNAADIGPIAHRTFGTTTCAHATGTGRSTTTATRPRVLGRRREVVSVHVFAGDAEEQRAGPDLAGSVGDVRDGHVAAADRPAHGHREPRR